VEDIRQCAATTRNQTKFVVEALQWIGECKCKVASIKPNWQANWIKTQLLRACWTELSL